ncbi:MAG: hypothetical protein QOG06_708 [Gaiellaceae bacterium]|nr:hypothetical protein [Gaiellaceae bacterium]
MGATACRRPEPLDALLRLAHFSAKRIRPASIGHRAAGARLNLPLVEKRREALVLLGPACVRLRLAARCKVASVLVRGVVSGELTHAPRLRVEGDDARHRAVEERAVVRNEDKRAAEAGDELFEPVESREVEIVRRLVQAEHVEPSEQ